MGTIGRMTNETASVSLISLGCSKNEVDSEEMLGILDHEGYLVNHTASPATVARGTKVVIINTCSFIESARKESIDTIKAAIERKRLGEIDKVIVTGCLPQRYREDLVSELPEVDAFLGTGNTHKISSVVLDALSNQTPVVEADAMPHHQWLNVPTRVRKGTPWSAYLKISEGCDHACTFCSIPSFRGKHVSKPEEMILTEARMLAEQGVLELNLIAQDSTQYGHDLYGEFRLAKLLKSLSKVDGIQWIRLFYCYPSRVNDEIIDALANTPKVLPYIDMPLQHADSAVLRRMRRPMNADAYLALVDKFRAASPQASIRTTFIVGFPGETEGEFENLLSFVKQARFDRVGAFTYSVENGTPSAILENRVDPATQTMRRNRLMELQQGISLERNQAWVGEELEALVEGRAPRDFTMAVARTFRDAPEVDGQVYVRTCMARPGSFVKVRVTEARPYDLIATPVNAADMRLAMKLNLATTS